MTNHVYPKYKAAAIRGGANVNLLAGVLKLVAINTVGYTYGDSHEFLSDIPGGSRIAISAQLTSPAVTDLAALTTANGRFDAVTGAEIDAVAMFIDTGVPSTSRLVFYQDTGITGVPVTPAGAGYNLIMDPTGWFQL